VPEGAQCCSATVGGAERTGVGSASAQRASSDSCASSPAPRRNRRDATPIPLPSAVLDRSPPEPGPAPGVGVDPALRACVGEVQYPHPSSGCGYCVSSPVVTDHSGRGHDDPRPPPSNQGRPPPSSRSTHRTGERTRRVISAAGLIRETQSESPRCYPYSFCASPVPVFDLMFSASSDAAPPVAVCAGVAGLVIGPYRRRRFTPPARHHHPSGRT